MARGSAIYLRSNRWSVCRCCHCAFDVWVTVILCVTSCTIRQLSSVQRVCRNVRIARGYLGLRSISMVSRPIRRCCIYYGCILVHCFPLVCESGRDLGEIYEPYICLH